MTHSNEEEVDPEYEAALEHFGIPGMKWGVRRARGKNGRVSSTGRRKTSETSKDRRQTDKLIKRPVKTLTNKQIQQVNNRLQLERTLGQLKTDRSTVNKGHNYVKAALAVAGTGVAIYKLVNSKAGQEAIGLGQRLIKSSTVAYRARRAFG